MINDGGYPYYTGKAPFEQKDPRTETHKVQIVLYAHKYTDAEFAYDDNDDICNVDEITDQADKYTAQLSKTVQSLPDALKRLKELAPDYPNINALIEAVEGLHIYPTNDEVVVSEDLFYDDPEYD